MRISSTDVIEGGRVLYAIGKIKAATAWYAANGAPKSLPRLWTLRRRRARRALREPVSVNSRTGLRPAEMEIGKSRAETGARNPAGADRNTENYRPETGACQPNPRECRGLSRTGKNLRMAESKYAGWNFTNGARQNRRLEGCDERARRLPLPEFLKVSHHGP